MKTSSILFLLYATFLQPETTNQFFQDSKIIEVRFGTSFGQCSGFCIQEVSYKEGIIEKTLTPHRDKSLKSTKCSSEYLGFSELSSLINLEEFAKLEVTIGCPDCNDGGAEWVQIFTSDGIDKKVTYHYSKEPEAVKPYISELRKYYDQIGECE